jgi:Domain of unknown function (DUF4394)
MNKPTLPHALVAAALCALAVPAAARDHERGKHHDRDNHRDDAACVSGSPTQASRRDGHPSKSPLQVVGLTADGQLLCFGEHKPAKARVIGTLAGFAGGDSRLLGIDFRPQDSELYGVGNSGGLYRVDTTTAMLTAIGQLSTPPDPAAGAFGVDFNPAANALRIVSDTGQNLRQSFANLGTGTSLAATAVDGTLGYTAAATPGPMALGVVGAAYTNNDLAAATATSLFVLDVNLGQVALQSPANAGFLVATGQLGVAAQGGGFDIYSVLRGNVTVAQRALAALHVNGATGLYDVDLLTGRASWRGHLPGRVTDIAVPLNQH